MATAKKKRKTPAVSGDHKQKGYILREKEAGQLDRLRRAAAKAGKRLVVWLWEAVDEKIERER